MNPKLGDVGFKSGGKTYVLNMGVNAMCVIEHETDRLAQLRDPDALGDSGIELVQRVMRRPRFAEIRLLFWGGLQRHHEGLDIAQAGDIVQALNMGEKKAYEFILESMRLCSPTVAVDDAEVGDQAGEDPQPDGDGTGTPSS